MKAHMRHDITDRMWEKLEPELMGRKGTWGGNARDNRQFSRDKEVTPGVKHELYCAYGRRFMPQV